jgi:putative transposase
MPSHFHWIVEINPSYGSISDIMRDIKKQSAWDLMDALKRERKFGLLNLFARCAKNYESQQRKLWMPRFDDKAIQSEQALLGILDYIHNNPVKAGMVDTPEEFLYSSARNYYLDDHSVIKVNTNWKG